jgi:hypothetical protein
LWPVPVYEHLSHEKRLLQSPSASGQEEIPVNTDCSARKETIKPSLWNTLLNGAVCVLGVLSMMLRIGLAIFAFQIRVPSRAI